MRKTLRILLWIIKGVLLLIALAALVMWPVSEARNICLSRYRYTAEPEREWSRVHSYGFGCCDGALIFFGGWRRLLDRGAPEYGIRPARESDHQEMGEGWHWRWTSHPFNFDEDGWHYSRWGPFRYEISNRPGIGVSEYFRTCAAPLWLVAVVTGTWPLGSIVLALRRRATRRGEGTPISLLHVAIAASFSAGAAWIRTLIKLYSRLRPDVITDVTSDSIATLALFAVIYTVIAFLLFRHRRRLIRQAQGLCPSCGYDLRATPDPTAGLLAICPECGQKTSAANPAGTRGLR